MTDISPSVTTKPKLNQYPTFQTPREVYLPMIRAFDAISPIVTAGPINTKTNTNIKFRIPARMLVDRNRAMITAGMDSTK